jgi:hypothetical protein
MGGAPSERTFAGALASEASRWTGRVYTLGCVHMNAAKKGVATTEVTMREFRAAPAKVLRRAARAGTRLRVGEFVLAVEESAAEPGATSLHGSMAGTGHVVGDPRGLLSADERWSTDG